MNRTVFIISILLVTVIWVVWQYSNFNRYAGSATFLLFAFSGIIIARRRYLKMKPSWGGSLTDIPHYFVKP